MLQVVLISQRIALFVLGIFRGTNSETLSPEDDKYWKRRVFVSPPEQWNEMH
jgi:hypothetical protein